MCVSRLLSEERKSILRKNGKLGSNHTVKFSEGTWHHVEARERNGPSQGVMQKSLDLMSVVLVRKHSRKERRKNPCNKKDAPEEMHEKWRNMSVSSKKKQSLVITRKSKVWSSPAPSSKNPRKDNLWWILEHQSMHVLSRKDLNSAELENLRVSRNPRKQQYVSTTIIYS